MPYQDVEVLSQSSVALSSEGQIYAWGRNDVGQLGIGILGNQNIPKVTGPNLGIKFKKLAQGTTRNEYDTENKVIQHNCAISQDEAVS